MLSMSCKPSGPPTCSGGFGVRGSGIMGFVRLAKIVACSAAVLGTCALHARAQCGGWVHDLESYGPEFLRYFAPRIIDRDGADGAQIPRIVGVGIDRLVMKSDQDWAFLSERLTGEVYPLEAWDADGPGPMTPRLYFRRASLASGDDTYLDSVPWPKTGAVGSHALAPVPGRVYDMRLTDPDGPGPARPRPIVVCAGAWAGSPIVVLEWDGTAWIQRGSTLIGASARVVVSSSASGGGDEWLLYGNFYRPGPPFVNAVARFDGSNWVALGAGLQSGSVSGAALWDHDDDPSSSRRLVVAGSFTGSGTTPLKRMAMFDGTNWISLGDDLTGAAHGVAAYVHVTTGREELLVSISASDPSDAGFAAFNGVTWRDTDPVGTFDAWQAAPQTWDPDGPLSDPPAALVLLSNYYAQPRTDPGLFVWNGEAWHTVVQAPSLWDSVQTSWDRDGEGPARPVIAHVRIRENGHDQPREVALWDGVSWEMQRLGFTAEYINAITQWDPDGDGPRSPLLVLGGAFTIPMVGAPDALNVIAWDGESLVTLGDGLRSMGSWPRVKGLTTWDPDGAGPTPAELIAFGSILGSGDEAFSAIARFDGERWLPLGSGVWQGSTSDMITSAAAWDPDLEGPLPVSLVIGGEFRLSENGDPIALAKWDGVTLRAFETPMPPSQLTSTHVVTPTIDSRSGAAVPALLVGHTHTSSFHEHDEYSWTHEEVASTLLLIENSWEYYRSFVYRTTFFWGDYYYWGTYPPGFYTSHDPDGSGPRSACLLVTRTEYDSLYPGVSSYGLPSEIAFVGGPVYFLGYWDDYPENLTHFRSVLSHGLLPDLRIASYSGKLAELVVTNSYTDTANPPRPIDGIARWMEGPPHILEVAEPRTNPETRAFGLTVHAIGGGDLGYQWTRNGEILKGGVTSRGSIVHSPAGPTLIISNASHLDEGEYQCRVINACGSTLGPILSMPFIHCAADVNFDGTVDILDLLDFLQAYGECEGVAAPCGSTANSDFNGDTMVDIVDFLDFFDRFGQGC